MNHIQRFRPRDVKPLPTVSLNGWRFKRYAIVADGRRLDDVVAMAATNAASKDLPTAGNISDPYGNHGISFQIIHFAEVAVVAPTFYWQSGSVLANMPQMRAQWDSPTTFETGTAQVIGCVWEMKIICFEVAAWQATVLDDTCAPEQRVEDYLSKHLV